MYGPRNGAGCATVHPSLPHAAPDDARSEVFAHHFSDRLVLLRPAQLCGMATRCEQYPEDEEATTATDVVLALRR